MKLFIVGFKLLGLGTMLLVGVYCASPREFHKLLGSVGIYTEENPRPTPDWNAPDRTARRTNSPPARRTSTGYAEDRPLLVDKPLVTVNDFRTPGSNSGGDWEAEAAGTRRFYPQGEDPRTSRTDSERSRDPFDGYPSPTLAQLRDAMNLAYGRYQSEGSEEALRTYQRAKERFDAKRRQMTR